MINIHSPSTPLKIMNQIIYGFRIVSTQQIIVYLRNSLLNLITESPSIKNVITLFVITTSTSLIILS